MCQTLTPLKSERYAIPCGCPSASIPNALPLLFPKDFFFTHPFSVAGTLTVTHSDAPRRKTNLATQPYQHDKRTNILPQNFWRPSFIQEKQRARSLLVTLASLPPSFISKTSGLAAKSFSPPFQAGSVRETWQEIVFDKDPTLGTSERALSFISLPCQFTSTKPAGWVQEELHSFRASVTLQQLLSFPSVITFEPKASITHFSPKGIFLRKVISKWKCRVWMEQPLQPAAKL